MEMASYITGLVDGEGCFTISFSLRKKMKNGIEVRPSFSVSQHKRNKAIIYYLRDYFNCGAVRFSKRDENYKFETRSIDDLIQKIIPHFDRFQLQTSKSHDFEKFKCVCVLVKKKQHLNSDGLTKIISYASLMNEAGIRKYDCAKLLQSIDKMKV